MGEGSAHSDDLLHSVRVAALSLEDRNLATALVMGVLRWQIELDARIARQLARPGQRLPEPVAIALRMGAFQLLHMDRIPPHAAINESVELCRAADQAHAAGMVNAILRQIARQEQGDSATAKRRMPLVESPAAFAERLGHPAWLVERWAANYGREAALAICEYDQREPGEGSLFAEPVIVAAHTTASLPAAPLQIDDGSRLVAELAAAVRSADDRSPHVWDCCAAPGGKTLVLAERLPKAQILATDINVKRLTRMEKRVNGTRHAERIRCEVMDAARPDFVSKPDTRSDRDALFDLILCDAPCSGTGTLARNPEIRHRLRPEELARQAARQQAVLRSAIGWLAPGGQLLYSTCSLEPEENEQVIAALLPYEQGLRRVPLEPALAELARTEVLNAANAGIHLAPRCEMDACGRSLASIPATASSRRCWSATEMNTAPHLFFWLPVRVTWSFCG